MSARATKALEDFHTITPHLTVRGVAEAIAFYGRAFGAAELYRNLAPDGQSVMHAELMLGDSRFFIHDEFPEHGEISPLGIPCNGVKLHLYVDDVQRRLRPSHRSRRQRADAPRGLFLGRSLRNSPRSFRPPMVDRDAN